MNKINFDILLVLFISTLCLLGCVDYNSTIPGLPFTVCQIINKGYDSNGNHLDCTDFKSGVYDGNYFSVVDGNIVLTSVPSFDINSADINWSQIINFPSGCGANQAVKIVGSSLVCVDLPVDTNWQTSWTAFDANLKAIYPVKGDVNTWGDQRYVNVTGDTMTGDLNVNTKLTFNEADWNGGNVVYVPIGGDINTYIKNAVAGDTLILASGTYTITNSILVTKAINITGQGIGQTIITNANVSTPISVTASNVRLNKFTLNSTASSQVYAGIRFNGTAGTVLTGEIIKDIEINVTSSYAGAVYGIDFSDASGKIRNANVTGSNSVQRFWGIVIVTRATAETTTSLYCYDCKVTSTNTSGGAYGFMSYDNSLATQDSFMYLFNCQSTVTGGTAWAGVALGPDAYLYAEQTIFNGSGADIVSNTTGVVNLKNCVLVNAITNGTITYTGRTVTSDAYVENDLTVSGQINVNGVYSNATTEGYNGLFSSESGNFSGADPWGVFREEIGHWDIVLADSTVFTADGCSEVENTRNTDGLAHFAWGGQPLDAWRYMFYAGDMNVADGNLWVSDNVSAQSFTDRTPAFSGTSAKALEELVNIKSTSKSGFLEIDHNSLPKFTQVDVPIYGACLDYNIICVKMETYPDANCSTTDEDFNYETQKCIKYIAPKGCIDFDEKIGKCLKWDYELKCAKETKTCIKKEITG
jgi:hypothetical protein